MNRIQRATMLLILVVFVVIFVNELLQARSLDVVHGFNGPPDGWSPWAAPIHDKRGNYYATTWAGGALGFGTVFKIDSAGKETILHNFVGGNDGSNPWAGLTIDAAGNIYGTTNSGGGPYCFNNYGCGVVFRLSPHGKHGWKETILYAFKGASDGAHPGFGTLARDTVGNLYGTTTYGGGGYCSTGCGVVFRLTHIFGVWKEQVLHVFASGSQTDGTAPYASVVLDDAGNLYGTTSMGGSPISCNCGTVFELDKTGKETILYNFTGGADGFDPIATLLRDAAGNLYGTTLQGGSSIGYGYGTAFKLDPTGAKSILHTFNGYPADGAGPRAALVRDSAGNLFGTTYYGGNKSGNGFCAVGGHPSGCGTVFKIDKNGKETVLHNFSYPVDGAEVSAGVALDAKGNLYGATAVGGPHDNDGGIVYKLTK
jgi:uncharacterized repeat protein (TIGR03803 family)